MARTRYRIGIDVGGTFTDVLCYEPETRTVLPAKVPSTPGSQWRGVLDALAALGIEFADIAGFVHGTTIATNALLERKGARTGMVTTEGFRDAVEIGRTRRLVGGLFDVKFIRAAPLASREVRLEAPERTLSDGRVESGLDGYDFSEIVGRVPARGGRGGGGVLHERLRQRHHRAARGRETARTRCPACRCPPPPRSFASAESTSASRPRSSTPT